MGSMCTTYQGRAFRQFFKMSLYLRNFLDILAKICEGGVSVCGKQRVERWQSKYTGLIGLRSGNYHSQDQSGALVARPILMQCQ